MSEQKISGKDITAEELEVEISLQLDEDGDPVTTLEDYLAAKRSLFVVLGEAMEGKAGSSDEVDIIINELMINTAKNFADIVNSEEGVESKVPYAAHLFHQVSVDMRESAIKYETPEDVEVVGVEALKRMYIEEFDGEDDAESHYALLENSLGYMLQREVLTLLKYAKISEVDKKLEKRERIINLAREAASSTAKITIGAAVFALVNRAIDRK